MCQICLFPFPKFMVIVVALCCLILQQLLQLLLPTSRITQLACQIPIIPSQQSQYCALTWNHGINMHLDTTLRDPTFFSSKQQPCLRHVRMFSTLYFIYRKGRSLYFKHLAKKLQTKMQCVFFNLFISCSYKPLQFVLM